MFRIAFDPDLPLVATSAFPDGTVAAGEVFDWRAKGLQPIDVLAMFRSGLLAHGQASEASTDARLVQLGEGGPVVEMTPGPRITVETPKQKRQRAG